MHEDRKSELTRLLQAGPGAVEGLLDLVYAELHTIAQQRMVGERAGHTLQATALVSEAYMRLVGTEKMQWRDRQHFYSAAAEAMRRVLVDHARKVLSLKRGGAHQRVTLGDGEVGLDLDSERLLALDDALERLTGEDERAAAVTRLRFFGGLDVPEIAATLEISERTVHREWTFARARLFELMGQD